MRGFLSFRFDWRQGGLRYDLFDFAPRFRCSVKKLLIRLAGVVMVSTVLSSAVSPAFALGGCGPNRHRNGWGHCVWAVNIKTGA